MHHAHGLLILAAILGLVANRLDSGLGFRVSGVGFRVWGLGFRGGGGGAQGVIGKSRA